MVGERITYSGLGDPAERLANVSAFLATPTVQALQPGGGVKASAPDPTVDWIFWAKTLGITAAVVAGFLLLTKV